MTHIADRFVAVDWGTTNRRLYLIEQGSVISTRRDHLGAQEVSDYPEAIAAIRREFGCLPLLLAGMAGSTIGWQPTPYVPAPADLSMLVANLTMVAPDIWILPGVSCRRGAHGDVMRGEEVQLLGAAAAGMVSPDALLCQPGTHCKWVTLAGGRITSFVTTMTGELFALLRANGTLSPQLDGVVADGPAFRAGVAEGAKRDIGASLFGIRSSLLLGLKDGKDAAAVLSGILIGADVAARLDACGGASVEVVADQSLGALYAVAIDCLGARASVVDSDAAFVAGMWHIWKRMQ